MADISIFDASNDGLWVTIGIAVSGGVGTLFLNLFNRMNAIEKDATDDGEKIRQEFAAADKLLWEALKDDRDSSQKHRESIIEKVAALPTKEDFKDMEARILRAVGAAK